MKRNEDLNIMITKEFKEIIFDGLKEVLKPLGYKKSGSTFSLSNGEITYYINVQGSRDSTATTLKLTLNIEIASAFLFKYEDTSIPEKWYRNYTKRIGQFQDSSLDKWWVIETRHEALSASNEIIQLIKTKVLAEINTFQTTEDLARLWGLGKSPGLTQYQKTKYLNIWEEHEPVE